MTVLFRCRVDPKLLKRADKVTATLGTSTPEMFRIFLAEIARTGKVPVNLKTGPSSNDDIEMTPVIVDTWEKLGPSPEIDYAKLPKG